MSLKFGNFGLFFLGLLRQLQTFPGIFAHIILSYSAIACLYLSWKFGFAVLFVSEYILFKWSTIAHSLPSRFARSPGCNMGSSRSTGALKERLKWTKELHELFEKAVNQIGGPDRATPKGILKAMAIPGLSIYHVKSHLQKYRMSTFTPEGAHKDKIERRSISEELPNFSMKSAAQLNEALRMQMEAQRRWNDQIEVQKSLKMKIEAQERFMDRIFKEYKNRVPSTKPEKPYSSPILSLPSLSEVSDQSNEKEFESDYEVGTKGFQDEFRARKKIKIHDEILPNFNVFPLEGNPFAANDEIGFCPWTVGTFPSPLLPSSLYDHLN